MMTMEGDSRPVRAPQDLRRARTRGDARDTVRRAQPWQCRCGRCAPRQCGRHGHEVGDDTARHPATSAGVRMTGVVGGDVGRGRYTGKILDDAMTTQPKLWLGHARYEFHGRVHSFVADLHITENDGIVPITATIQGTVTSGWLKGAHVTGQYRPAGHLPDPHARERLRHHLLPGQPPPRALIAETGAAPYLTHIWS